MIYLVTLALYLTIFLKSQRRKRKRRLPPPKKIFSTNPQKVVYKIYIILCATISASLTKKYYLGICSLKRELEHVKPVESKITVMRRRIKSLGMRFVSCTKSKDILCFLILNELFPAKHEFKTF